jgi:hypothetical protein
LLLLLLVLVLGYYGLGDLPVNGNTGGGLEYADALIANAHLDLISPVEILEMVVTPSRRSWTRCKKCTRPMGLLLSCRFKMSSIMKWPVIF